TFRTLVLMMEQSQFGQHREHDPLVLEDVGLKILNVESGSFKGGDDVRFSETKQPEHALIAGIVHVVVDDGADDELAARSEMRHHILDAFAVLVEVFARTLETEDRDHDVHLLLQIRDAGRPVDVGEENAARVDQLLGPFLRLLIHVFRRTGDALGSVNDVDRGLPVVRRDPVGPVLQRDQILLHKVRHVGALDDVTEANGRVDGGTRTYIEQTASLLLRHTLLDDLCEDGQTEQRHARPVLDRVFPKVLLKVGIRVERVLVVLRLVHTVTLAVV
ncbi:hypothetical protein PFISCL1PPCAC_8644, partial [Pristionchus fissidentatus]